MDRATSCRRFSVKTEAKPNERGWSSTVVTVFDGNARVGAYERNYPRFGAETFEPFEWQGTWYALYSPDYTCTRVMTLPDCREIGGEERHASGFCPVELFVPRYRLVRTSKTGGIPGVQSLEEAWLFESEGETYPEGTSEQVAGLMTLHHQASAWRTLETAFVAGCHWGDDSTWKLQTIDLTRVSEGIISRRETFGYLPLAAMPLTKAVSLRKADYTSTSTNPQIPSGTTSSPLAAVITRYEWRDIVTGAVLDPLDF